MSDCLKDHKQPCYYAFCEADRLLKGQSSLASATCSVTCPVCEGDGEVYRPTGVPDAEPYETCPCCNGSKKLPTPQEICELREELMKTKADLWVTTQELEQYKEHEKEMSPNVELCRAAKNQ